MASQLFEAPSHEAQETEYEFESASPEGEGEFEYEFESASPEGEGEFEYEFEGASPEGEGEFEFETETEYEFESPMGASPEYEYEYEYETEFETEGELEGEYFSFGSLGKLAKGLGRAVAPLAKRFAPTLARSIVGMIPGVGGLIAPMAGQLVGQLVKEAEGEAKAMEAEFFGIGEGEFELANTGPAHEAALAEVLAAQAAESSSEGEAESFVAASLPVTITIHRAKHATRRVMPHLVKANRRLVNAMRRHAGPDGRQLTRLIPKINAQTAIALRNAHRRGHRVTGPMATRIMAHAARRVLSNTPGVARSVAKNMLIRGTHAKAHRHPAGVASCVNCVGRGRAAHAARRAVGGHHARAGAAPRMGAAPHVRARAQAGAAPHMRAAAHAGAAPRRRRP
ncbi:MAG: hypothetical protein WAK15_00410 [Candidatus Cybelea sp.]